MKTPSRTKHPKRRSSRSLLGRLLLGATLAAAGTEARAAETAAAKEAVKELTPEQQFEGGAETYNNWIELSAGALFSTGDEALARQRQRLGGGGFGGIEDLHYQGELAKKTTFAIDGRGIFDEHDYSLGLSLNREDLGYLKFRFENYRTWYDGTGGYYPPDDLQYHLPDDELALDRGEIAFEAGLAKKGLPLATFKDTHRYREGEKSSTIWGPVHPALVGPARGLYPSFYDIDEKVDTFELDLSHHIKKTDLGVGVRYEKGDLNNALKSMSWAGETDERNTDRQGTTYDLFNVHAFSETWLKKNVFFSAGYMFTSLDSEFSGSRIYGSTFDAGYMPGHPFLGYTNLLGEMDKTEHMLNLNLMLGSWKNWTLVPSVRVQKSDASGGSSFMGTYDTAASAPFTSRSDREYLDLRERLDLRYTGFTNWVLSAGAEWMQGDGSLDEDGGIGQFGAAGMPPIDRETDDTRNFHKYSLNARWYPTRKVALDVGGYCRADQFDYDHSFDSTTNNTANRYPAYLTARDSRTYDGNVRITLRPFKKVTFVTRYEYQVTTIHTTPDSLSGLGEEESGKITSHIFAQNVSWVPWSRLGFNSGYNYVVSQTKTPVSDYTAAVLEADNNYFTANINANIVLDQKTDLSLGYFLYWADNYQDNSAAGVAYGVGTQEHGVSALLTRRLTPQLRLNLRYAYTHSEAEAAGGHSDFDSHAVFSSLQYRF